MKKPRKTPKTKLITLRVTEDTYRKITQEGSITEFVTEAIECYLRLPPDQKTEVESKKEPSDFWDERIARVIALAMEQWKKENGVD